MRWNEQIGWEIAKWTQRVLAEVRLKSGSFCNIKLWGPGTASHWRGYDRQAHGIKFWLPAQGKIPECGKDQQKGPGLLCWHLDVVWPIQQLSLLILKIYCCLSSNSTMHLVSYLATLWEDTSQLAAEGRSRENGKKAYVLKPAARGSSDWLL